MLRLSLKNILILTVFLPFFAHAQKPYEGPYLEALVKYKTTMGEDIKTTGWGLGFRMDTLGRRYVTIVNDGWLTKLEYYYDSTGHTTREVALQLATGVRHVYDYTYQWLSADTLESLRNDYALTTQYIYKNKLLQTVEKTYYGSGCKVINEKPTAPEAPTLPNTTCSEHITFYRDSSGEVTGKRFSYYYSKFKAVPEHEYLEDYRKNNRGLIDTVLIGEKGKNFVMAFEYDEKGKMLRASRKQEGKDKFELWKFKYKHNGLLKKVTYHDFPDKTATDKYHWKHKKWKQDYPIIPHLSNFMESFEVKLLEDFYFGY